MTTKFKPEVVELVSEPLPLENSKKLQDQCRIWIGNMDLQLNEYSFLQLLKQFEGLKDFDFIYYKNGPHQGKSKGFGFATYNTQEKAKKAIQGLNNRVVFKRKLQVRWAHEQEVSEKPAPAALTTSLTTEPYNTNSKIAESSIEAIEKKLMEMEKNSDKIPRGGLHPLLQEARIKKEQEEARKRRMHPYTKPYRRKR